MRNHVHLVLELPPHVDIARLVQGLKGASARIANRDGVMPRAPLRWANGYDLRSLSVRDLKGTIRYVRSQSERHPELALKESPGSQGATTSEPGDRLASHVHTKYAGNPLATMPSPISACTGRATTVFRTIATAAAMNSAGVTG